MSDCLQRTRALLAAALLALAVSLGVAVAPQAYAAEGGDVALSGPVAESSDLATINLYPVNEELMFKFVNAYIESDGAGADLVFALSGEGYHYVFAGTVSEAMADVSTIKEKYADKKTVGRWICFAKAEVDQRYASDRADDDPSYQEHEGGVAEKYQFRLPITDENALAAIKAGTGSFRVPLVAVSDSRAKIGNWTAAFTARQGVVDLAKGTIRTGNFRDELDAAVSSELKTMEVLPAGKINTVGMPTANEYTCQPTFTVTGGVYDRAFIGTAEAAVRATNTITADEGIFVIPLTNSLGRISQIDVKTWQATVAFHVAESVGFDEAGTWVERIITVKPEIATIVISGNELTAKAGSPEAGDDRVDLSKAVVTVAPATYTGNALTPAVTVVLGEKTLAADTDYTVAFANNIDVSKDAKVTITGRGSYKGVVNAVFTIGKADNNLIVKAKKKTQKVKAKKKTVIKAAKAFWVTANAGKGKVTYALAKAPKAAKKFIKVSKAGNITVKKGLKKGKTYTIKVKATSQATSNYNAATKTVSLKVKVK